MNLATTDGRDALVRHPVSRLRDLPLAVTLALAVAIPLLAAGPAAASAGHGQLIVNPGTVAPGQRISVLGTCPVNGVQLTGVYSPAFVGGAASISKTQINFSGSATISPSASGSYRVSAACGPGSPSVTITVSGARTAAASPAATVPAASAAAAATVGDGPVTSTGVVRVGLAAAACALGVLGFLRFRRRRTKARNTHS